MAHFAELDENNIVLRVVVVGNADTADENGVEDAAIGVAYLNNLEPDSGAWLQTSYNANIRGQYAGIGGSYNPDEDIFHGPAPWPSWIRTGIEWNPPVEKVPGYLWDEDTLSWVQPEAPFEDSVWTVDGDLGYWAPPVEYPGVKNEDGTFVEPYYEWDQVAGEWTERAE